MATVRITLEDMSNDGVHGKIEFSADRAGMDMTIAEKIGTLMMQSFSEGNIPGLHDAAIEVIDPNVH
jgi:hypothetical protein